MVFSEGGETLKKRRHTEILSIIAEYEVENQEMLQLLLKERGYNVTQATISRDINELNLEKNISKIAEKSVADYIVATIGVTEEKDSLNANIIQPKGLTYIAIKDQKGIDIFKYNYR